MGRRSRRSERFTGDREIMYARQAIEHRWRERLVQEPTLSLMVTARGAPDEPFHRWIHYKQGFSAALVRQFLEERVDRCTKPGDLPVLDPFAGSGTVPIECARRGVPAVGVEAMASLAFLAGVRQGRELPPFPAFDVVGEVRAIHEADAGEEISDGGDAKQGNEVGGGKDINDEAEWKAIADRLTHPLHRAALMLAVSRRHTSTGRINRGADPLPTALKSVLAMIREDVRSPLPVVSVTHQGDARRLAMIDDESIGAILTSPPYLSRHDYAAITAPLERVYRHWYPTDATDDPRGEQTTAPTNPMPAPTHPTPTRANQLTGRANRMTTRTNQMTAKATVRSPNRAAGFSPRDPSDSSHDRAAGSRSGEDVNRARKEGRGPCRAPGSRSSEHVADSGEHVNDAREHVNDAREYVNDARSPSDDSITLAPSQGGIKGGSGRTPLPEAAREAADQLQGTGEAKLASVVRAYFVDFAKVLAECHRVLTSGGVAWFVVGGARLKGVHIPSDIIVAEQMQAVGFTVNAIRVAREVTNSRRKFANLGHIAPRESVIVITKR